MGVDLETVTLMGTYRVGYLPPEMHSLVAGELYLEVTPAGGGPPRLWVGAPSHSGLSGDVALLLPEPTGSTSAIMLDDIANPSPSDEVRITGTVDPGDEIELAALQGEAQVNTWSPWDATTGDFTITWYLPAGDNYRVRVRMRSDPETFVDSNLFAVT